MKDNKYYILDYFYCRFGRIDFWFENGWNFRCSTFYSGIFYA